jgi:hypothetical protein
MECDDSIFELFPFVSCSLAHGSDFFYTLMIWDVTQFTPTDFRFTLAYKKCKVFFRIMHHKRVTESAFRKKLGTILMNIIKDGCASSHSWAHRSVAHACFKTPTSLDREQLKPTTPFPLPCGTIPLHSTHVLHDSPAPPPLPPPSRRQ